METRNDEPSVGNLVLFPSFKVRSGDVEWGRENGGRCLRNGSNKAMVKSRIEIEKVLEAKTNKQRKQETGFNIPWSWTVGILG